MQDLPKFAVTFWAMEGHPKTVWTYIGNVFLVSVPLTRSWKRVNDGDSFRSLFGQKRDRKF